MIVGHKVEWRSTSKGPPDVLSAIIGDVIHNLRTALDLLACELCVRFSGTGADDKVHFPFCKDANSLGRAIKDWHFDRAGPDATRLLKETIKPYPSGNAALAAIHALDIQDKHQAVILGGFSFATPAIAHVLVDGKPGLAVAGDPTKATDLALVLPKAGPLGDAEIVPTLHKLVETTAGVIEAFKRLSVPAGLAPIGGN